MRRDLILGTAGHIDHGKTALIRALTGIDCDRLPEEKKRGITIDIGFARLDLGEIQLGIIDVPGHERFIKNMLAGATGIDLALLVVSAGESIKPQTREHLEILKLLGIKQGVIALTKIDLVDETSRDVAALEIRDLVKGTFLEAAPLIATSARTHQGIAELKEALRAVGSLAETPRDTEWFRLPIDRSFVVQGQGTVVTGSILSGQLAVGAEVEWLPSGQRVRVRSLQNHDTAVDEVRRGQRAAINLAGIAHEDVKRGQELATPGYLHPTRVLSVRLHTLADARGPIKHRTEARLHIGTAEVMTTVSLLEGSTIAPGQSALAQFFLEEPVMATWGQPFVLRDSSAEHTLGGGQVLQPSPRKIRRRHLDVLEKLECLESNDASVRSASVAWLSGWAGCTMNEIVRDAGASPSQAVELLAELQAAGKLVEIHAAGRLALMHVDRLRELEDLLLGVMASLHAESPLLTYHDSSKLFARMAYVEDVEVLQGVVARLVEQKKLVGDGKKIARADFKPKLSVNQRKLKDKVVEAHRTAAFQPPSPDSFAAQAAGNASALKDIFEVAVAEHHLVRVAENIYLHADAEVEMMRKIKDALAESSAGLTVAEIRDLLGTTRKYAVPICEYLDRVGVTRRAGDLRVAGG